MSITRKHLVVSFTVRSDGIFPIIYQCSVNQNKKRIYERYGEKADDKQMVLDQLLLLTSGVAVIMDLHSAKIENAWLLFMLMAGFSVRFYKEGWRMLFNFGTGALLPFLCLFLLFLIHALGAGDIKLLCVLGGMLGPQKILQGMWYALMIGGGISIMLLISLGEGKERIRYFFRYCRKLLEGELLPYGKPGMQTEKIHFTIPVFLSMVLHAGGVF